MQRKTIFCFISSLRLFWLSLFPFYDPTKKTTGKMSKHYTLNCYVSKVNKIDIDIYSVFSLRSGNQQKQPSTLPSVLATLTD